MPPQEDKKLNGLTPQELIKQLEKIDKEPDKEEVEKASKEILDLEKDEPSVS